MTFIAGQRGPVAQTHADRIAQSSITDFVTMSDGLGLGAYLYEHIPISKHFGVEVEQASAELVRLVAPLDLNLNHRKTGFGGSISAVAILASWSLLWCRLRGRTSGRSIVI